MFNFKQVFAYETIEVPGITDCICDQTGGDGGFVSKRCAARCRYQRQRSTAGRRNRAAWMSPNSGG